MTPEPGLNPDRPTDLPPRCPCCYCRTISERDAFEICPVCFWEDDGQDDRDADDIRGGPNEGLSLTQARANYVRFGAMEREALRQIRAPRPDERP
jgi:hypothetical protein